LPDDDDKWRKGQITPKFNEAANPPPSPPPGGDGEGTKTTNNDPNGPGGGPKHPQRRRPAPEVSKAPAPGGPAPGGGAPPRQPSVGDRWTEREADRPRDPEREPERAGLTEEFNDKAGEDRSMSDRWDAAEQKNNDKGKDEKSLTREFNEKS